VLFVVFFKLLFGEELDDMLEHEKSGEKTEERASQGVKREGTGHDELTKVCAAEESERRASQQQAETQHQLSARQPQRPDSSAPQHTEAEDQGDQSYYGQATAAASNLATSVATVYTALGFGNSSSTESEASSRSTSPQPGQKSMHTEIDEMDDATVEQYLQSRQGNV
jgi:hypothetical protein